MFMRFVKKVSNSRHYNIFLTRSRERERIIFDKCICADIYAARMEMLRMQIHTLQITTLLHMSIYATSIRMYLYI